jgi:hypothetical protein
MPDPVVSPGNFSLNLPVTAGEAVGTMTATNSPTAWSIVAGNSGGFYAIDNSGNITITSAGASGLGAGTSILTVQATAAVSDPHFSNVVLLMGFEGTNGSTGAPGFTDESSAANGTATVTSSGMFISTTAAAFGASSMRAPGTSAKTVTFPNSANWNFGSGAFTVEAWVNPDATVSLQLLAGQWLNGAGNVGWTFNISAGNLNFLLSTTGSNSFNVGQSAGGITAGVWQHVAFDFDGTKYRIYIGGVNKQSTTTVHTPIFAPSLPLTIGATSDGAQNYKGYLDELRITKGVARYASDVGFTVPTAAFPRS